VPCSLQCEPVDGDVHDERAPCLVYAAPMKSSVLQYKGRLPGHSDWVSSISTVKDHPNLLASSSRDKEVILERSPVSLWQLLPLGIVGQNHATLGRGERHYCPHLRGSQE